MNPSTAPREASGCHGGNIPCLQDPPADGRAESMFACTCGARFPGTLEGAWAAKLHGETVGHDVARPGQAPGRAPAGAAT